MTFRFATEKDSAALLQIYGQYLDTAVTFEYCLPTEEEFAERIRSIGSDYPYLVCEEKEKIIGYAYAHCHMERAAYQWNAELSVYLDGSCTSRGIGSRLYQALFEMLRLQNVKTVYGCVTVPNERSEALHEKLGFSRIGTYCLAGYKNGAWHDVCWFEKQIAPHDSEPLPWVSLQCTDKKKLKSILQAFETE